MKNRTAARRRWAEDGRMACVGVTLCRWEYGDALPQNIRLPHRLRPAVLFVTWSLHSSAPTFSRAERVGNTYFLSAEGSRAALRSAQKKCILGVAPTSSALRPSAERNGAALAPRDDRRSCPFTCLLVPHQSMCPREEVQRFRHPFVSLFSSGSLRVRARPCDAAENEATEPPPVGGGQKMAGWPASGSHSVARNMETRSRKTCGCPTGYGRRFCS